MNKIKEEQDFFSKILLHWLGVFILLIPLCFCFYTYDSVQVKINLFYLGSFGAFFIWLSSLIYKGQSVFTKKNFYTFLPILIYAAYIVFSYFFKPYRLSRLNDFIIEVCSFLFFIVICFGLKTQDFKTLLRYFFIGAWVCFCYGLVQISNLDFLPWKDFFSNRVFSTFANPNLLGSFVVFTAVLSVFSFFIKPQKNLIILFILALINLFFTGSKGAFLSFGLSAVLITFLCSYFFTDIYKKYKKQIICFALIFFILAGGFIFLFASKRMDSLSFRVSTWRSAFDMVKAQSFTGSGIASFEIIYPAYKRPEIFYMESLHNAQTQHAENYYLEQWATLGTFGFGLFLWVIFYILKQALFKIKVFIKESRERALLLSAFLMAACSIYIHNLVDVSIYFVSTEMFLVLFNGAVFNLAFGPFDIRQKNQKQTNPFLFKIISVLTLLIIIGVWFYIYADFWQNFLVKNMQSFLQFIYLIFFVILSITVVSIFIKILFKTKKISVCLLSILFSFFCLINWFYFISGVYFSRATALAEKGRFEALNFYTKALKVNPTLYTAWNFRGLMLFNRFSLLNKFDPEAGDKKNEPLNNDFTRALRDFNKVKELMPDMALLDYNIGSLYLKYAGLQEQDKKEKFYLKAQESFKRALLLDPVNENIYFQLANIELARNNNSGAIYWVQEYLKGPSQVVSEKYLKRHSENEKANQVLNQLNRGI